MKKRSNIVLIVVILLCLFANTSYSYLTAYIWPNTYSKYYTMNSIFSTDSKNAFSYANLAWNDVTNGPINIYRTTPDNNATDFNLGNGQNEVFKKNAGTSYLMCASMKLDGSGYISEFDICVNSNAIWANNGSSTAFDVQNCATHEIGHVLFSNDITQQSQVQSAYQSQWKDVTMYYLVDLGETKKRSLHQDDKDGFVNSY